MPGRGRKRRGEREELLTDKLSLNLESLWDTSLYLSGSSFWHKSEKSSPSSGEKWVGGLIWKSYYLLYTMEYKTISSHGPLRRHIKGSISSWNFQILMSCLMATWFLFLCLFMGKGNCVCFILVWGAKETVAKMGALEQAGWCLRPLVSDAGCSAPGPTRLAPAAAHGGC